MTQNRVFELFPTEEKTKKSIESLFKNHTKFFNAHAIPTHERLVEIMRWQFNLARVPKNNNTVPPQVTITDFFNVFYPSKRFTGYSVKAHGTDRMSDYLNKSASPGITCMFLFSDELFIRDPGKLENIVKRIDEESKKAKRDNHCIACYNLTNQPVVSLMVSAQYSNLHALYMNMCDESFDEEITLEEFVASTKMQRMDATCQDIADEFFKTSFEQGIHTRESQITKVMSKSYNTVTRADRWYVVNNGCYTTGASSNPICIRDPRGGAVVCYSQVEYDTENVESCDADVHRKIIDPFKQSGPSVSGFFGHSFAARNLDMSPCTTIINKHPKHTVAYPKTMVSQNKSTDVPVPIPSYCKSIEDVAVYDYSIEHLFGSMKNGKQIIKTKFLPVASCEITHSFELDRMDMPEIIKMLALTGDSSINVPKRDIGTISKVTLELIQNGWTFEDLSFFDRHIEIPAKCLLEKKKKK